MKKSRPVIASLKNFDRNRIITFKKIRSESFVNLKAFDQTNVTFYPLRDNNNNVVTGLTEDVIVREKGKVKSTTIGTRKVLEKELFLNEGELLPNSPYWDSYNVILSTLPGKEASINLDLTQGYDLLKYLFLYGRGATIATSLKEVRESAYAKYVLFSEQEESKVKNESRRSMREAYRAIDQMGVQERIDALALFGLVADSNDGDTIEDKLAEKAEESPTTFLEVIESSNVKYLGILARAMTAGVITVGQNGYAYGEVELGETKEDVATYLMEHATITEAIRKEGAEKANANI